MHRKMIKALLIIQVMIISVVLTSCWDKIEIDERSFVLAMGIDHVPPKEEMTKEHQEMQEILQREDHYRVTLIFPKQLLGFGGEIAVEKILLSSTSDNIYAVERQLQTRTDSQLFLGHLKSVILGEAVVKNPQMFKEVLDALETDRLISRKVNFAITEGEAKEALQVKPKLEPITGQFISELFGKRERSSRAPLVDLNEILISMHRSGSVAIPRIIYTEDELKLGGAAVIKDYEFIGWLGEAEAVVLQTIKNAGGIYTITINYEGSKIPYQATEIKSKLNFEETAHGYKMMINIEAEGDILQHFFPTEKDVLNPELLEELQELIDKRYREGCMFIVNKLQKEFKADILGFDEHIKKYHPKIWDKIGSDWEEVFPTIDVEVFANSKIRRVGLAK